MDLTIAIEINGRYSDVTMISSLALFHLISAFQPSLPVEKVELTHYLWR